MYIKTLTWFSRAIWNAQSGPKEEDEGANYHLTFHDDLPNFWQKRIMTATPAQCTYIAEEAIYARRRYARRGRPRGVPKEQRSLSKGGINGCQLNWDWSFITSSIACPSYELYIYHTMECFGSSYVYKELKNHCSKLETATDAGATLL